MLSDNELKNHNVPDDQQGLTQRWQDGYARTGLNT